MPNATCSIELCNSPVVARGWCSKHWQRWKNHGDPNVTKTRKRKTCEIDGCSKPAIGQGFCTIHYQRLRRHGDPLKVIDRSAGTCSVDQCGRKHYAKGLCSSHWKQQFRGEEVRTLSGIAVPFKDLLWSRINQTDTCWLWTGPLTDKNYGYFQQDYQFWYAHRYMYTRFIGPIPEGIEIDHICWVTNCVNPEHLRLANRTQQNEYRQGPQKHSKTGVRNVHIKRGNTYRKFAVEVGHNGRHYYGGAFYTIAEAKEAAEALRRKLHSRPS